MLNLYYLSLINSKILIMGTYVLGKFYHESEFFELIKVLHV